MKDKIIDYDSLIKIGSGGKATLAHGVFDLLHIGHIKHLQAAKNLEVSVSIFDV